MSGLRPDMYKDKKTLKYDNHCTLNHRNQQQFHNTPFFKTQGISHFQSRDGE